MSNNAFKKLIAPLIITYGKKIEAMHFTKPPIFIVACPRSGTTMLLSILSAHPNIFTIKRQTYAFDKWTSNGKPRRLDRLYREFIFNKIAPTAHRWCEKTPKHLVNIDNIKKFIPSAKIINIMRDGRDVITSRHPKHKSHQYWVSPKRWIRYAKISSKNLEDDNFHLIRYEDIIHSYEETLEQLLAFLDEPYTQEIAQWHKNSQIRHSKHLKGEIKQLHSSSIGRWKKPEHSAIVKDLLALPDAKTLLKTFNYLDE